MKAIGKIEQIQPLLDEKKTMVVLSVGSNNLEMLDELSNVDKVNVEIKRWRKKRTLDSNAYMWQLIKQISEITDVDPKAIYRDAISYLDTYYVFPLRDDIIDRFEEDWKSKGDGWFCERFESKFKGYTNVRAYYGSSQFDTKQMSKLVDFIVEEAKQWGIETLPPKELESLKASWKK